MFNKKRCFVKSCGKFKNHKNKISLFGFPTLLKSCCKLEKLSRIRQKKWKIALKASAIKSNTLLAKFCVVCSDHFIKGKPASILDVEDIDWVPTLNLEKINENKSSISEKNATPEKTRLLEDFETIILNSSQSTEESFPVEILDDETPTSCNSNESQSIKEIHQLNRANKEKDIIGFLKEEAEEDRRIMKELIELEKEKLAIEREKTEEIKQLKLLIRSFLNK